MKNNHSRLFGQRGEDITARYLEDKGWHILARNYHSRYGEIDIIAADSEYIAFIEVKTRKKGSLYTPAEAVTFSKQKKLILTAQEYLLEHPSRLQPRFDVCEVYGDSQEMEQTWSISYLTDAFQLHSQW